MNNKGRGIVTVVIILGGCMYCIPSCRIHGSKQHGAVQDSGKKFLTELKMLKSSA